MSTFTLVSQLIVIVGMSIAAVLMAVAAWHMKHMRDDDPEPWWVRIVQKIAHVR